MTPRKRCRRLMGFLGLVLQQLLLVEDSAAAHSTVAAGTTVPDIGQGPYAAASEKPPPHGLFLDSSAVGRPHALTSDRRPHPLSPSQPAPHLTKLHVDGTRTRRRDHPPSKMKQTPPDSVFPEISDDQRGLTMEEGGAQSLSTLNRFPPDSSLPEISDGQRGLVMAEGGAESPPALDRFPPDNIFLELSNGQRGLAVTEAAALCVDDDSFFVASPVVPDAEGCYFAAEGTSFGHGFVYVLEGGDDDRNVYPKLVTMEGESEYFWAVALVEGFAGGDIVVDCISKETTTAASHPAGATWQCDVDGTGGLVPVTNSVFSVACGCGTTTTTTVSTISGASTSSSTPGSGGGGGGGGGSTIPSIAPAATPAPVGGDTDRGLGTLGPRTAPPGEGATGKPTSPPTQAEGCYDDDDSPDFTDPPSSEAEPGARTSSPPSVVGEGTTASGGGLAPKGPLTPLAMSAVCCVVGAVLILCSW